MTDFPDISRGTQWEDIPARQWRNVMDTLEGFERMTVSAPLRMRRAGRNVSIALDDPSRTKPKAETSLLAPFILTGMNKDFVLAEPVGGGDEVKIAKPYKLRMNPFHNQTVDGISYDYDHPTLRSATFGELPGGETQLVIPRYRIPPGDDRADLIWAVKVKTVMDYGLDSLDPPLVPEELEWLDVNVDGRAWAQKAQ